MVVSFIDRQHVSNIMYEHPDETPSSLIAVQHGAKVLTTNQAIELAEQFRGRLAAMGYATNCCGQMSIRQPTWNIKEKEVQLPAFVIQWAWTLEPETRYLEMEIDGLRSRPNLF